MVTPAAVSAQSFESDTDNLRMVPTLRGNDCAGYGCSVRSAPYLDGYDYRTPPKIDVSRPGVFCVTRTYGMYCF